MPQVARYNLSNGGVTASFISYGATLLSLKAPDKDGELEELCLQHESLSDIQAQTAYYGKRCYACSQYCSCLGMCATPRSGDHADQSS
jgi:galactose mutarotase-like enzyme